MQDIINYPLLKGEWDFEAIELLNYIEEFDYHSSYFSFINEWTLITEHSYPDGLNIRITWAVQDQKVIKDMIYLTVIHYLIKLKNDRSLICYKVEVINYSKESNNYIPQFITDKFNKLLRNKQKIKDINEELYFEYEYNISSPIKIKEKDFKDLVELINNYNDFEKYYAEYKKRREN